MVGNLCKRQFPGKEKQDFIVHIVGPVYISWNSFYVHIFEKKMYLLRRKNFFMSIATQDPQAVIVTEFLFIYTV